MPSEYYKDAPEDSLEEGELSESELSVTLEETISFWSKVPIQEDIFVKSFEHRKNEFSIILVLNEYSKMHQTC